MCAAESDDKFPPRTILEDPCNVEFASGQGRPWFDIAKSLAWEPWYPRERTSGLDVVASQRSRGLCRTNQIEKYVNF